MRLFDLERLDDRRALALVMSIQLADLKLKQGQFGDCLQLLEGYWPRYLNSNVPLERSEIARPPKRSPERTAKPNMFERVKDAIQR